jgi:DNA-binding NarL/FixJ family response regulator
MRVVVAEDSVLLREGLVRLLTDGGFEVVGSAASADELLGLVRATSPDVAIVDIRMPPTHTDEGIRAATAIRAEHAGKVGVLVLSQYVEPAYAYRLIEEEARGVGYLLKDRVADVDELSDAVRRVGRGGSVIDPSLVAQLLRRRRERDTLVELTDREQQVLALMAEGRSNQAIGETLGVTPKTVETHIASIFSKLGLEPAAELHRRVLAVLAYLRTE